MTSDSHDEPQPDRSGRQVAVHRWTERDLVLRRVAIARGTVVLVGLIAILAWPDRSPDTTATVLGAVALGVAVTTFITGQAAPASRNRSHMTVLGRSALLAAAGIVLILWPAITTRVVGLVAGSVLAVLGLTGIYRGLRGRRRELSASVLWRGVAMTMAGALMLLLPEGVANVVLTGLALVWAADAIFALFAVSAAEEPAVVPGLSADLLGWVGRFPMDDEQRQMVTSKLYFEGAAATSRLWRFGILMALSTAIATLGIFVDSTAVVIGAMLIAPLMAPIMGTAAALVSAWPIRAVRALLIVGGGVVLSIAVAWILTGMLVGASEPIISNSQITSRVDPTAIDLLIALAAGAAGAFAVSRSDIADSLPGAAIAVALVPPLAVAGITLRVGEFDDVVGSFLLFLTNLVGMILAGALVFLLTGYTPVERLRQRSGDVGRSLTVVAVLTLLIALPLVLTGQELTADLAAKGDVESVVKTWKDGTDLEIVQITVDGSMVTVVVAGSDTPENVDDLGAQVEQALGRNIDLEVTVLPTVRLSYESTG